MTPPPPGPDVSPDAIPSTAPSSAADPAMPAPAAPAAEPAVSRDANPAFIRLAMRNMVRKGRQSLLHFGLTALGLTGFLVFLAWLGRPQLPQ